jgi:MerR family transcriptional regulator, light-induced transcriptional regulator
MVRYSIKDLENYTEIKAHTIRIWEQRYNLLAPKRTDSNIRYYSNDDLKKIININLLYVNGLKISKIAQLSEDEITMKAKEIIVNNTESGHKEIDTLLIAITEMNPNEIRRLLSKYDEEFSFRTMYSSIIIPLLVKMGELWQTNSISIAHEHHFSNILREFYILKTNMLAPAKSRNKTALLFLPEHEEHELSLLYFHYLLKEEGFHCIYLGKRVPLADLAQSVAQMKPDLVVTNLIARIQTKELTSFFIELVKSCNQSEIRLAGSFAVEMKDRIPAGINLVNSEKELLA